MHTIGQPIADERTTHVIADTFRLYWPDLAVCLSFLIIGVIGEVGSCMSSKLPYFSVDLWPVLYSIAVVFTGIRFGRAPGLACAGVASISTIVVSLVCAEHNVQWSLVILFVAVGLIAGWIGKRNVPANWRSETLGEDALNGNKRSVFELGRLMTEVVDQFRTPIASIQGAGFVLEDPDLPREKRQEFVGILRKECQRLQLLVELLDFTHSRWSAEKEADVHRLFDDVIVECAVARGSQVALTNQAPREFPLLGGEPELIKRALVVLVTEVVRSIRGSGEVVLSAQLVQGETLLRIGANTEDALPIEAIWARAFAQSDLAMVRNVVERNGGSMRFESNTSNGASICIVLPARRRKANVYWADTSRRR